MRERERKKEREMNLVVARGGWLMVEKWREDEHERVFFFLRETERIWRERERECVFFS